MRIMKLNGDDDSKAYSKVNYSANSHVGIKKVDKLIDVDVMKRRYQFLKEWRSSLLNSKEAINVD